MPWIYGTAAAENESNLVKEKADVWDKALQPRNERLGLLFFAQRRTHLLRQGYMVLGGFADLCKHQSGYGALPISRIYFIQQRSRIWKDLCCLRYLGKMH